MQMQSLALVLTHFLKDYVFPPNALKQWFSSYYMNSAREMMFPFRLKRPSSPQFLHFSLLLCISFSPSASLQDGSQNCTGKRNAATRCIYLGKKETIMPLCHYPALTLSEQSHSKSIFQEHPPQHDE